jgi:class 3 adenylate cyclase
MISTVPSRALLLRVLTQPYNSTTIAIRCFVRRSATPMARIFLSHSSGNNAEAIVLRDWLIGHGWDDLFLDLDPERGLKAGERWQAALKQAAERCELVIFLVSPEWAASKWCLAEFLLAKNLNKRIVGVIVDPIPLERLPVEMTGEWQLVDLTEGKRDNKVTVTPPPGDKRVTVAFAEAGLERLHVGLMQAGLDARYFVWPPEHDPERAPYRGLEPLEAEDAGIFFGRDGPIVLGLDRLRGLREAAPPRLLVILGASGAGKSSFLRAGLLPRLARESQHFLPLPVIRPERAVLSGEAGLIASLETALKTAGLTSKRVDIRKVVEARATSVASLLQDLVKANTAAHTGNGTKPPTPPTLVLAIDQAEELFHAEGAEEALAFLDLLGELAAEDNPALIVVFTIRSDAYERLQEAKQLEGLRKVPFDLGPMPRGSYAEVIKGPAHRLEGTKRPLKIEESLVDELLADIEEGGSKDALPLLAFTLERLYREEGGDGDLKLSEYEELGRVKGSIEAAVERALKAADSDPKIPRDREARLMLLRRGLIPWLAGIDPDTSSPRRRIARRSEIPPESAPLLDLLVEQRLLATDVAKDTDEITIEPVHEALLRQWGQLQGWLAEDAGLLGVLDGVKRASRDWVANDKGAAWLTHAGERLEIAERLAERPDLAANLKPTERGYLAACRNSEQAAATLKQRAQALLMQIRDELSGDHAGMTKRDAPLLAWMKPLARFAEFGTSSYPPAVRRRLTIVNVMAFIIALSSAIYAVVYAFFGVDTYWLLIAVNLMLAAITLLAPLAHRINDAAAALVIAGAEYIALFFFVRELGRDSGIQINYIIAAAVVFAIFGMTRFRLIITVIAIGLVLHLATWFLFPPDRAVIAADPNLLANLYVSSAATTFCIIALVVGYAFMVANRARAEADALVANILPEAIADRLKESPGERVADGVTEASVLFSDLIGFTELVQRLGAARAMTLVDQVVTEFDRLAAVHGVQKITTIGDGCMAVAGVSPPQADHLQQLARMALLLPDLVERLSDAHGVDLKIRVGIASGPVVAGVVGDDILGETVNLASRLESHGLPGEIQVSSAVRECLGDSFVFEPRGPIEVRGVGRLETWLLKEERGSSANEGAVPPRLDLVRHSSHSVARDGR